MLYINRCFPSHIGLPTLNSPSIFSCACFSPRSSGGTCVHLLRDSGILRVAGSCVGLILHIHHGLHRCPILQGICHVMFQCVPHDPVYIWIQIVPLEPGYAMVCIYKWQPRSNKPGWLWYGQPKRTTSSHWSRDIQGMRKKAGHTWSPNRLLPSIPV
jgi:hypothetical protein